MRDYQPVKTEFRLPKTLYHRVLSIVRDYDRQKERYNEILYGSSAPADGMPRSSSPGNPVEHKAEQMDTIFNELKAIDQALVQVPGEYRRAMMDKIKYDRWPRSVPVGKNLYGYWKSRFLYCVAKNLHLL